MWLRTEETGDAGVRRAPGDRYPGALVALAEPLPGARPAPGRRSTRRHRCTLPAAPLLHAFVVSGALLRSSLAEPLSAGDAFGMTDEPEHEVTAGVPTELLVWTFG